MAPDVTVSQYAVDQSILEKIIRLQGDYAGTLSGISPEKIALDLVNPVKARNQAEILRRFTSLDDKSVLEVGTGCGMNLIVWAKEYGAHVFGIEPDSSAFTNSSAVAHELFRRNGLNTSRLLSATGENLPFHDSRFDVVYSTNVLEHTCNPVRVIYEAMRVCKPGGMIQFVYPNYHSFFDGHYTVFHPPVLFRGFFPWYIKTIGRKNPEFAGTLRTELNVVWTRKTLQKLKLRYDFNVLSLGADIFAERMMTADLETWGGLTKVRKWVLLAKKLKLNLLLSKMMCGTQTWTPVILTLCKRR